jgi:hypothetical protein
MEVDLSWLEAAEEDAPKQGRRPSVEMRQASRKVPAVRPPPMPGQRRETMEVQAEWLELEDAPPAGLAGRRTKTNMPKAAPPPAPAAPEKVRQAWEPPPLPPPPTNAARARRALPPPLPRGEDDAPPPAPAKRESRRPPRR